MVGESDTTDLNVKVNAMTGSDLSVTSKNQVFCTNSTAVKRLGDSSSKVHISDLSKPPGRLSPVRKGPARQLTPKRLASPTCLKDQSTTDFRDRSLPPNSNRSEEEDKHATSLIFTTSPTKLFFSSDKKIGGDGSLSKLRSRFSNGLLSPQRLSTVPGSSKEVKGKNLLSKLQDQEYKSPKNETSTHTQNNETKSLSQEGRVTKSQQQRKKTVKFKVPDAEKDTLIETELADLKSLLLQVLKHQKVLESKLINLENNLNEKNEK